MRTRLWILIGAVLLLQIFVTYYSLNYGVLEGLLQWDDVAFVERALVNLDLLAGSRSPYELIRNLEDITPPRF